MGKKLIKLLFSTTNIIVTICVVKTCIEHYYMVKEMLVLIIINEALRN